ncbi:MAG: PH domain-containing protein [Propionibacteriales bacterium]|nr:PH domain-containing protein [Propionibacteriales bacterium]
MAAWLRRNFADPQIGSHLLVDEGEVVIDEVRHHWVVYWRAVLEVSAAVALFVVFLVSSVQVGWLPFVLCWGFACHAGWLGLNEHMDRFVITNMRVFRVRGVLSRKLATMPITRILDITVEKPLLGRALNYGHFIFESAAQEQGLKDIRYVGSPDVRDLTIQRVVQRSGLRRSVS